MFGDLFKVKKTSKGDEELAQVGHEQGQWKHGPSTLLHIKRNYHQHFQCNTEEK